MDRIEYAINKNFKAATGKFKSIMETLSTVAVFVFFFTEVKPARQSYESYRFGFQNHCRW